MSGEHDLEAGWSSNTAWSRRRPGD